jgi:hypothetical protein
VFVSYLFNVFIFRIVLGYLLAELPYPRHLLTWSYQSFFVKTALPRRKEAHREGGGMAQQLDLRKYHPGLTPKAALRGGSMKALTLLAEMVVGLEKALKIDGRSLQSMLTPPYLLTLRAGNGGKEGARGWEGGMSPLSRMTGLGGRGTTPEMYIGHLLGAMPTWEGGTVPKVGLTGGTTDGLQGRV